MERLQILLTGRIWHEVLTFNGPLQPQMLMVEKPEMRGSRSDGSDGPDEWDGWDV